ncbi:TPA: PrsW family intramembrane metalloprotease [Streptococcus suis]|nr:PrsW family intramembrane metalloprotease [Streptococcus suis]
MKKQEWVEAFEAINGRRPSAQEYNDAKIKGEFSDDSPTESSDKTCPKCHQLNATRSQFCPNCGAKMDGSGNASVDAASDIVSGIANKINSVTGGEGPVELRMRDLFSEVFKKHTREEAENIFACGSEKTTPRLEDISREWPKPWYFARVFGFLLISTLLLYFMWVTFNNQIVIPGLIFVSSMIGAIPILFFYFEINSPRNIDLMTVIQIFFFGGLLSLVITLTLFQVFPTDASPIATLVAAAIEEIGKIVATSWYIQKLQNKRFLFNGLLIGGAVGAGFDVFESAGYTFNALLGNDFTAQEFLTSAIGRGLTGIAAHVAWGAITGAGVMMVLKKNRDFSWSLPWTGESLRFLILTTVLHTFWNTPILPNLLQQGILILLALIVILIIINRGLKEINELGRDAKVLQRSDSV